VALSRALTEAAQSRLTYISGARDDLPEPARARDALAVFRSFAEAPAERRLADLPDLSGASVAADVERVAERLARCGHEPYFVDLTRPEIGLAVTRAFAPGLGEAHHA
jgi:ribosomal protein S12 methylthiotransferase accessory factor